MLRYACIVWMVTAGCSNAPVPQPRIAPATPSAMDRALAFERGTGVARDYAQAAAIYRQQCDEGRGDRVACRALIRALNEGRGVDHSRSRASQLALATCERSHDAFACTFAGLDIADDELPPSVRQAFEHRPSCDAAHRDGCEALVFVGVLLREKAEREVDERACAIGVLDGCSSLIEEAQGCGDQSDAAACLERHVAHWKEEDDGVKLDALARLSAACDAGDALACRQIPGRRLPSADLCRAHDWSECAALGCLGDAQSDALARAHGGEANCSRELLEDEGRRRPVPPTPH